MVGDYILGRIVRLEGAGKMLRTELKRSYNEVSVCFILIVSPLKPIVPPIFDNSLIELPQ